MVRPRSRTGHARIAFSFLGPQWGLLSGMVRMLKADFGDRASIEVLDVESGLERLPGCDMAIIDANTLPDWLPRQVTPLAIRRQLWMVADGNTRFPAAWMPLLGLGQVPFIDIGAANGIGLRNVQSAVVRVTAEIDLPQVVATLSADRAERVSDLVAPVLDHPWDIRHPSDLGLAMHMTQATLRKAVRSAGFRRVEHFLAWVRAAACAHIRAVYHVPARRARLIVGIDDVSNFRRQLRRARDSGDLGVGPGSVGASGRLPPHPEAGK